MISDLHIIMLRMRDTRERLLPASRWSCGFLEALGLGEPFSESETLSEPTQCGSAATANHLFRLDLKRRNQGGSALSKTYCPSFTVTQQRHIFAYD